MCLSGCSSNGGKGADSDPSGTKSAAKPTVTCPDKYEERHIIVAQGLEFQAKDRAGRDIPRGLINRGLALQADGKRWCYTSHKQRVFFTLRVVTQRTLYRDAIQTDNVHLIYDGHARYGRGPCFGNDPGKGEQWENGLSPEEGIFRMGSPYLGIPVHDVIDHGYTAALVPAGIKVLAADSDPELAPFIGSVKSFKASELDSRLHPQTVTKDPNSQWLGYRRMYAGKLETFVVIKAGWQKTACAPLDLGAVNLKCRVFCHFGCSTYSHNYPVLRGLKRWIKSGDRNFAYWTSAPAFGGVTPIAWLFHLFSYSVENAFQPWEPSLKYTQMSTNAELDSEYKGTKDYWQIY